MGEKTANVIISTV